MENHSQKIDILISMIKEREVNFKSFVKGFHEYRKTRKPKSNEILEVKSEPKNKMDKIAVAVIKDKKIVGHLSPKQFFYFLRCEYNDCQVKIEDGKVVNLGDGTGMIVPCILLFGGQSEFIDILSNKTFQKYVNINIW